MLGAIYRFSNDVRACFLVVRGCFEAMDSRISKRLPVIVLMAVLKQIPSDIVQKEIIVRKLVKILP